jgi:hypothetical protein
MGLNMREATCYFLKRDPGSDNWQVDREPVRAEDDPANTAVAKLTPQGERWVRRDPENHRYEIKRH